MPKDIQCESMLFTAMHLSPIRSIAHIYLLYFDHSGPSYPRRARLKILLESFIALDFSSVGLHRWVRRDGLITQQKQSEIIRD
jgi:hypothetical protein